MDGPRGVYHQIKKRNCAIGRGLKTDFVCAYVHAYVCGYVCVYLDGQKRKKVGGAMVKMNTKRILVVRVYAPSQGDDQTGRVCQINPQ